MRAKRHGSRPFCRRCPLTATDERRGVTLDDPALLIYTSGTTGLPKAANVSHHRVMSWSHWFAGLIDTRPDDRLYNCLPHVPQRRRRGGDRRGAGRRRLGGRRREVLGQPRSGTISTAGTARSSSISASSAATCSPRRRIRKRTRPRLRLACGNGLGGESGRRSRTRFAIPRILEFYAATEGNFSLYNVEGKPGAIGRMPRFLGPPLPGALVRVRRRDRRAGARRRRLLHSLSARRGRRGDRPDRRRRGARAFEGYTDAAASEKKMLRDVFEPGDAWVRTGDLMRTDEQGFFYFVDRIGDTFRWKGENVATAEVAAAIERLPGVADACVYGVSVPGAAGRAGMAAIVPAPSFDLGGAARAPGRAPAGLRAAGLPAAGRRRWRSPRPSSRRNRRCAAEGLDPARVADPLFFDDRRAGAYVPLDASAVRADRSRPNPRSEASAGRQLRAPIAASAACARGGYARQGVEIVDHAGVR